MSITAEPGPVPGYRPRLYTPLSLGAIQPQGWLRHQLQLMKAGSTGHLDEVYHKVKQENGWLGGKGDGWEETPYWLDGALPLAYLLQDTALTNKVLTYVNWTLTNQRPSGYFGPFSKAEREEGATITPANALAGEDWWPKMVMLKVLQQYYTATGDQRVIRFMTSYFHFQAAALAIAPLGKWTEWAEARGQENILTIHWLYGITKDPKLLPLARQLQQQSFAWGKWMAGGEWIINSTTYQDAQQLMNRHAVNVAMGIKEPALQYALSGDSAWLKASKKGFNDLMKVHGLPMGIFSADEDLNGNDPTQGAELCAVVEAMFSLEQMAQLTGDPFYADALERLAFNALPTQTTDDYNNKQYFQVTNQVQVSKGVFNFSLPFEREMCNVFGMRSGYTCCLANMHQGWTKFAAQLWQHTNDGGLAALTYAPSSIKVTIGKSKQTVSITEDTQYPFEDDIRFTITCAGKVNFPLHLRIPGWCREATILLNGQPLQKAAGGQIIVLRRNWTDKDQLTLQLPSGVQTSVWGRHSRAVERGPLVYALRLPERWEKSTDAAEGVYYSIYPEQPWNFGLLQKAIEQPADSMQIRKVKAVTDSFVWNLAHAPIEITVPARQIPGWIATNGVAHQPVNDRTGLYRGPVADTISSITLIPYGCTKVRVVAFPVVK
ncbi:MAG: glycoside hydrolase family 127 protein [Candidatus Pseudobacter hemicellulosilyticus]|uniref:Glycoside hydrolase family 127 protein n=1 Tax=Candidatus Pseudobacter hemicellulosilyticus TaxID=3121375 RepID=A0AAJ6BGR7_9BACT|nr:MAG: glycoside hydrolase family 127 protein [Pseudobacter sp.]